MFLVHVITVVVVGIGRIVVHVLVVRRSVIGMKVRMRFEWHVIGWFGCLVSLS